MINRDTLINVKNRNNGPVGYTIPEMNNLRRQYMPNEIKQVPFKELFALASVPGGEKILRDYLIIENQEALGMIFSKVEPEYFYTIEDVKKIMSSGTLDEFLDMMDFAPAGVIEMVKDYAVVLPLRDLDKIEAIRNKTGFDVIQAIEIKNTKTEEEEEKGQAIKVKTDIPVRRVNTSSSGRRVIKKG